MSCCVWDTGHCLKTSLNPTLQTYHSSWKLTASLGCCQEDVHSPLCLHDAQIFLFLLPTPTSAHKNILLVEMAGSFPTPVLHFFSKLLCFFLHVTLLPFFHLYKMHVIF